MFEDTFYYISEGWGDRGTLNIVACMSFDQFFHEFKERHNRNPFIISMITLDEHEFDEISEFTQQNGIFDGR